MQKISRTQYGLEQQIMQTIFRLKYKKSSELFSQPVDPKVLPDYYEKIKKPMDLQTIINLLKQGKYRYAAQVLEDLKLIITNCIFYNSHNNIIKKAEQFDECINTEWTNFEKELKKKNISINDELNNSPEILQRLVLLEEKKKKKKTPNIDLDICEPNKIIEPSLLPPIPSYESQQAKIPDFPPNLVYVAQNYPRLSNQEKQAKTTFSYDAYEIQQQFDRISKKKLQKYEKILLKKIQWIEEKVIKKCLEKKRFKKMEIPNHLSNLIESGDIVRSLQVRKIQMYVKQAVYWVQQYAHILSDFMKDKFVDTCRNIRRCLTRILRYKKIPKTTKIHLDNALLTDNHQQPSVHNMSQDMSKMISETQDDEAKIYQNKMKQFRRMLLRDRGQSTKRDTKIIIKNDGGQLVIIDWSSQANEKKLAKRKQPTGTGFRYDNTVDDNELKLQQQKKEQKKKDQQFLQQYKKRSNMQIILKYRQKLQYKWNDIIYESANQDIVFNIPDSSENDDYIWNSNGNHHNNNRVGTTTS